MADTVVEGLGVVASAGEDGVGEEVVGAIGTATVDGMVAIDTHGIDTIGPGTPRRIMGISIPTCTVGTTHTTIGATPHPSKLRTAVAIVICLATWSHRTIARTVRQRA